MSGDKASFAVAVPDPQRRDKSRPEWCGACGGRLEGSALPRDISAGDVEALLHSCDRATIIGRRNRAILTLLGRLGLRSCEVARLRVEDFDWRRGEVVVRGKGDREERLPIPPDVGDAVVAHLCGANNRGLARHVFVNARAPFAPMTAGGVQQVVWWAGIRAELGPIGAHRFGARLPVRVW